MAVLLSIFISLRYPSSVFDFMALSLAYGGYLFISISLCYGWFRRRYRLSAPGVKSFDILNVFIDVSSTYFLFTDFLFFPIFV